jgi:SpoVK/Ycf46/Vps4 family AAA+-type ATPase
MTRQRKDWNTDNQAYLMLQIKAIKNQLEWYKAAVIEKKDNLKEPDNAVETKELKMLAARMTAPPAVEKLTQQLVLSTFERDLLIWCAALELSTDFAELTSAIQQHPSSILPTFTTALAVLSNPHWSAISPESPLRYWQLIEINHTPFITKSSLKISEHILHYLTGVQHLHLKLKEVVEPVAAESQLAPSQIALADSMLKWYAAQKKSELSPVIQLSGSNNEDKLALAAYMSSGAGLKLYSLSSYAIPGNAAEAVDLALLWNREAQLNDYGLLIDCSDLERDDKAKEYAITSFIKNIHSLLIVNTEGLAIHVKRPYIAFDIEKPDSSEQLLLWKTVSSTDGNNETLQFGKLVSQFNLSAAIIAKAGSETFSSSSDDEGHDEKDDKEIEKKLWKTCCHYSRPRLDELAQRIPPRAGWNDIVLPEGQKSRLREIASQVKQRNKVYNDWGFASKTSRGLGISALFAGESGTGKTMAAEVLANDLQLDLYKIDLSKVVNKYIGETEKNLKRVFDAAEDGGAILLFDEADALFGKRSEVKDSHDRYSNIEVSYLLQRMEAYRGLAILTTNMKKALDIAFMRRLRFIVHFPFPDAAQRAEIWGKVFPEDTPLEKLDHEKLSRLSLPGGSIRNIALNAAFYAAHDNQNVSMYHLSKAAEAEYDKIEKPLTSIEIRGWQ